MNDLDLTTPCPECDGLGGFEIVEPDFRWVGCVVCQGTGLADQTAQEHVLKMSSDALAEKNEFDMAGDVPA